MNVYCGGILLKKRNCLEYDYRQFHYNVVAKFTRAVAGMPQIIENFHALTSVRFEDK